MSAARSLSKRAAFGLFASAACLAAGLLGGCKQETDLRPPVILISLDTLRADHVGFMGYSRVSSRDNWRVANALEMLHSGAGWNLSNNYFGTLGSGTGNIDTFLFQHTFSTARFLWHPEPFWGQEKDLTFTPFLMTNHISSDDPDARGAANKLKAGAFVTYTPARWFGMGARFDTVNPDLADSSTSFQVLSPRIVFRSDYASNEQVIVQYNAYFYGDDVTPAWPDINDRPDRHLLSIQGVIWW